MVDTGLGLSIRIAVRVPRNIATQIDALLYPMHKEHLLNIIVAGVQGVQ